MADLISIITVVYNGEETLEKTILSVINQTYKNIEYIIIDGASTDNTLEIIKKYEAKIDRWISEPDEGIYHAMNKGVDLATGKLVNFMNSGDVFFNNEAVASSVKYMIDNTTAVFYGNTEFLFDSGSTIIMPKNVNRNMTAMRFCHQSSFVRLFLLKKYYFDVKYKMAADYNFFLTLLKSNFVFKYIPVCISRYDRTGVSGVAYKLFVENCKINGFFSRKSHIFLFPFLFLFVLLKYQMQKIIPLFIMQKFRAIKYK